MDVEDLIGQLCAAAGMIMEEASVGAISTTANMRQRVTELVCASDNITVIAAAAKSQLEHLA